MSAYPHKGIAWSQKEKSRAASRPQPNKNHISYIPQSLRGLRYFFVRQTFFFSPGLTHHQAKTNSRAHAPFWCVRFYFVGKCGFLVFPGGTSLPCCRGPPSVWTSSRNSDETEVHSVDAGKKRIWVRGQLIEVTDEVYAAYMKGDRKMRYFEKDLKCERLIYGSNGEIKQVIPSRGRFPWTGSWKKTPVSLQLMQKAWRMWCSENLRWTSYIPRFCNSLKKNGISFVPCSLTENRKRSGKGTGRFPAGRPQAEK